jgi:hypothetical protein
VFHESQPEVGVRKRFGTVSGSEGQKNGSEVKVEGVWGDRRRSWRAIAAMIISFAYTWDALLAGRKTCTRRDWSRIQFGRFVRAWEDGRLVHQAWGNLPFVEGAMRGPDIRLTCKPYLEPLCDMPESDLEAEGGLWASKQEFVELFGGDPSRARSP